MIAPNAQVRPAHRAREELRAEAGQVNGDGRDEQHHDRNGELFIRAVEAEQESAHDAGRPDQRRRQTGTRATSLIGTDLR